jgi:hypothetical protein
MTDRAFASPDEEADLAETALAAGQYDVALHHVAGAISADPLRPRFLELCDRLFDAMPDAIAGTEPGDRPWFGNVAVHARALARDGRHTEAVHLLLQIVSARPDVPYLAWAIQWLDAPATAIDPDALVPAFARVLERVSPGDPGLHSVILVLDRLCASWSEPALAWYRAVLLCQVGDPRGTAAAEELFRRFPTAGDAAHPDAQRARALLTAAREQGGGLRS